MHDMAWLGKLFILYYTLVTLSWVLRLYEQINKFDKRQAFVPRLY